MKSLLLAATVLLATQIATPFANAAPKTATAVIKGAKATALIQAFLDSGLQGKLKNKVGTLKIDSLTTVQGIAKHECDDEDNIMCGFATGVGIQEATQGGKTVEVVETIQLTNAIAAIIDPALPKDIQNTDGGMGKMYEDYGQIACTWKTAGTEYHTTIVNSICKVVIQNNGQN